MSRQAKHCNLQVQLNNRESTTSLWEARANSLGEAFGLFPLRHARLAVVVICASLAILQSLPSTGVSCRLSVALLVTHVLTVGLLGTALLRRGISTVPLLRITTVSCLGLWHVPARSSVALLRVAVSSRSAVASLLRITTTATKSTIATVDDVVDHALGLGHSLRGARHGHFARVAGLIDLDLGAAVLLQTLDGLATAANHAAHHLLGAVHRDARTELGSEKLRGCGRAALQQVEHKLPAVRDGSGSTGDVDLAGVAVREVLVDGDRGHAGSLKALDRLSAAADDAPDKSRGAVDRLAGFGSDRLSFRRRIQQLSHCAHCARHSRHAPGDGDLFGLLVNLDSCSVLSLKSFDRFTTLSDDAANHGGRARHIFGDILRNLHHGDGGCYFLSGRSVHLGLGAVLLCGRSVPVACALGWGLVLGFGVVFRLALAESTVVLCGNFGYDFRRDFLCLVLLRGGGLHVGFLFGFDHRLDVSHAEVRRMQLSTCRGKSRAGVSRCK
mmetsp:Transcript_40660/g.68078  ORF Transcript_40660/g.68078 Transcript_40660/m.68078 type:complete len:499 (+) Transcript_40660:453-1949(+)